MTIDFIHMDGHRFEDMCALLFNAEFGAVPIRANPGDGGIDSFGGSLLEGVQHIWQYKHFPDGIGESQKKQIRESLKTAIKHHHPKKWTLVVPCDMDEGAQKWFERQRLEFAKEGTELDHVSGAALRNLLLKHQEIRQDHFPNTDDRLKIVTALLGGKEKLLEQPKASVLDFMQTGVDYINADNPDFGFRVSGDERGQVVEAFLRHPNPKDATAAKVTLMFPDDPVGKKVRQGWVDMHRKGTPFVVDGDHFAINQSVFDSLVGTDFTPSQLRVVPHVPDRRLPMRLTFTAKSGTRATLPFIDLRLKRQGSEEMLFTNEEQNHILIINLTANASSGGLDFTTRDYVGRRPTEVVQCEEALAVIAEGETRVDMEHLEMGLRVGSSALSEIEGLNTLDLDSLPFYRNLATVEQSLDPSLRIPESYYDRDLAAAAYLAKILTEGEITSTGALSAQMTVNNAEGAREVITKGEPVTFVTEDAKEVTLFDRTYVFDMTATITAPLTLVDVTIGDVAEGAAIAIRQEGEITQTFTNGRPSDTERHERAEAESSE